MSSRTPSARPAVLQRPMPPRWRRGAQISSIFMGISEVSAPAIRPIQWLGPALVLVAYAATAFVVPTMANVAVTDDWVYYRTVETLVVQHELHIHAMSSAALVFQAAWGGLFAWVFGLNFGVLRISTLVIVGISGLAVYGL